MATILVRAEKEDAMEKEKMENIILLKNLPSNLVEEAIVVLKENHKLPAAERKYVVESKKEKTEENYIIKEAEMLVMDYIQKLENRKDKRNNMDWWKKYKQLKKWNYALIGLTSIFAVIQLVIK